MAGPGSRLHRRRMWLLHDFPYDLKCQHFLCVQRRLGCSPITTDQTRAMKSQALTRVFDGCFSSIEELLTQSTSLLVVTMSSLTRLCTLGEPAHCTLILSHCTLESYQAAQFIPLVLDRKIGRSNNGAVRCPMHVWGFVWVGSAELVVSLIEQGISVELESSRRDILGLNLQNSSNQSYPINGKQMPYPTAAQPGAPQPCLLPALPSSCFTTHSSCIPCLKKRTICGIPPLQCSSPERGV